MPRIKDDNKEDVIWCVSNSNVEKTIRYAARALFLKINTTDKDVISIKEYTDAVKKLPKGHEKRLLIAAGKKMGDTISETEFVKLMSQQIQGTVTLTDSERSAAFQAATAVSGEFALEYASRNGLRMVFGCIPVDQINFLILFFISGYISKTFLQFILPLGMFYISYATIIITTIQILHKKMKLKESSDFAKMLHHYYDRVDVDQTQSQYAWNSLPLYLGYLVAMCCVVTSFSLADKMYIPCSELCVLNSVICGICFVYISDSHAHLYAGLTLNVGIPSICYSLIPVFFIQMARESGVSRCASDNIL
ncbi:WFS1-like protein [Mya arenaria]|uniref:WFS1-like protein n=1 Tax=Mya arenaria TaxID=6604 RepID=A0ABY7D8F9_MYAAR|nr:WFS1-like protein [Mya arenaria]